jgi:cytoskeletal protein CcmA (bactofilin family)
MAFEMFEGSKTTTATGVPLLSVQGATAKLEGKFEISDSIQIECEVGGEMTVGGKLLIGQNGIVRADVHTVDAVVMGQYDGNLVASGDVEIAATGRVTGNIETNSLVIAKGGFFNGNVVKIRETGHSESTRTEPAPRALYMLDERRLAAGR